jgi:hypothetical protein
MAGPYVTVRGMTTRQWQSIGAGGIPGTQYKSFSTKGTNELHAPKEKRKGGFETRPYKN